MQAFFDSVVALIIKTSTDLPPDVRAAMKHALDTEEETSRAGQALNIIGQNIDQAATIEGAICQDTGMPTFEVKTPVGADQIWMKQQIKAAIAEATRRGKLRPNSVDSLTGENSGNNLGPGTPVIHFEQWERDDVEVKLLLKGGGCENMNIQVLAAHGAAESWPRRSHARRRAQVPPARGVERARQGLRAWRNRRVHWRRSHERVRGSEAAVVSQSR